MARFALLLSLWLTAACSSAAPSTPPLEPAPPAPRLRLENPTDAPFHGVYPGGRTGWEDDIEDADIQTYVDAVGHEVAWVYFSHNWFHGRAFPQRTVAMIRARGSVPWIRLMMRSERDLVDGPDPVYRLERIRAGDFDDDLLAWGEAAARVDGALLAEWGTEMNGDWFSWNARYHGHEAGARLFAETYQHIVATVARGGADNITWVFHVNDGSSPERSWNEIHAYDPGPEVCPWVAVSVYGSQEPTDPDWWSFRDSMDAAYPALERLAAGRPLVLAEFGVTAGGAGDPSPGPTRRSLTSSTVAGPRCEASRGGTRPGRTTTTRPMTRRCVSPRYPAWRRSSAVSSIAASASAPASWRVLRARGSRRGSVPESA